MPVVSAQPQQQPQQMPLQAAVPNQPLQPPVMPGAAVPPMQLAGSQPVPQGSRQPLDLSGFESQIRQKSAQSHEVAMEQMRQKNEMRRMEKEVDLRKQEAEDNRRQSEQWARYSGTIQQLSSVSDILDAEFQTTASQLEGVAVTLARAGVPAGEATALMNSMLDSASYSPDKAMQRARSILASSGITPEIDAAMGGQLANVMKGIQSEQRVIWQQEQQMTGPWQEGQEPKEFQHWFGTPKMRRQRELSQAVRTAAAAAFQSAQSDAEIQAVEAKIMTLNTSLANWQETAAKAAESVITLELGIDPKLMEKLATVTDLKELPDQMQTKTRAAVRTVAERLMGDPHLTTLLSKPEYLLTAEESNLVNSRILMLTDDMVSAYITDPTLRENVQAVLHSDTPESIDPTTGTAVAALLSVARDSIGRWDNVILKEDKGLSAIVNSLGDKSTGEIPSFGSVTGMMSRAVSGAMEYVDPASAGPVPKGEKLYNVAMVKVLSQLSRASEKAKQHYDVRTAVLGQIQDANEYMYRLKSARIPGQLSGETDAKTLWNEAFGATAPKHPAANATSKAFLDEHGAALLSKADVVRATAAKQPVGMPVPPSQPPAPIDSYFQQTPPSIYGEQGAPVKPPSNPEFGRPDDGGF